MPRSLVHFTFLFFTLTALSGVWMRLYPFHSFSLTYTNILHAHSHLAMIGWAFLAVFVIFLATNWSTIQQKKQAKMIAWTLLIISIGMFGAFLYQGYGIYSIIMSTIHIFVEYWAAIFMYRQLKVKRDAPKSGLLFIKASLLTLFISSIGPFALGYISANGLKDSYFFDMAIYFYLHFQYNGWLTLFLLGMFIMIIDREKIALPPRLVKAAFWIYFLSLFPGYFLSVLWVDLGVLVQILAVVGSIGQWIGIMLLLFACRRVWKSLLQQYSKSIVLLLGLTLLLLFAKSTMELGLISPGLAELVYDTRSIVIGYLHLTLLGFVSIFIITQYRMVGIIRSSKFFHVGFILFFVGLLLNEIILFIQGLLQWLQLPSLSFLTEGLLIASVFLLVGIVIKWISFLKQQEQFEA